MGLGKTAQTIAHIAIEEAAGRMDRPALVVVPTSLVPNWTAELARFAPHLRVVVLHGLDRHQRRSERAGVHIVITTYAVLVRDIEEMAELSWHLVVLDEAQAIKNSTAKVTHAVCRLDTRHRLCLSGTPIENNLGELWSQFAFLMPGLLGSRKNFTRRFRTPIEKDGDPVRRRQLATRIRPFIVRRTKAAGMLRPAAGEAQSAPNHARTGAARATRRSRHTARRWRRKSPRTAWGEAMSSCSTHC